MEPNPAARSPAASGAASIGVYGIRQNLRRRRALSLILATLIVIAEMAALRPSLEAAKRPRAEPKSVEAPAFVLPPQPPSDVIVGGKIRTG